MTIRDDLLKEVEYKITYYRPHTRAQYLSHAIDYLDFVKRRDPSYERWKTREMVTSYMEYLAKKRLVKQAHLNYIIRGPVNILFTVSGLRIPVVLPPVEKAIYTDQGAMSWEDDQIIAMIKAAKSIDVQAQALLATITTWTPRAAEVCRIEKQGINFKNMVITIPTVKHNLIRRHLIPDEVQYYVCKYDWLPMTETQLRDWFESVVDKAGIKRQRRQSIHAFRHNLQDHWDMLGFSREDKYQYMGWVEEGTQGSYGHPLKFNPVLDKKFYEKHPYLPYWK